MLAGNERETLLRVADQLSAELGSERGEIPGADSDPRGEGVMVDILDSEDELLIAEMRRRLGKIAAASALDSDESGDDHGNAAAALDNVEMVMRREFMMGNAGHIPGMLPGLVFLVTLPVAGQDRALELSKRCALLVEQAF